MVKMLNRLNGNEMWVAEDRVEEYIAAGHRLAAYPSDVKEPEHKPKKTKKKTVTKK